LAREQQTYEGLLFRAFDKNAYRREDDLFDAAMHSVLLSLGDGTGARFRLKRVAGDHMNS
jgi:hypothetical protein